MGFASGCVSVNHRLRTTDMGKIPFLEFVMVEPLDISFVLFYILRMFDLFS